MATRDRQQMLWESEDAAAAPSSASATPPAPDADRESGPSGVEGIQGKTIYVVDAHSLIFQVFHVMPEMASPSGQPTGAVHGFIRDMFDLLEKKKPDYLFCAFDPPGDTFRHEIYEQYKADREEMPEDLRPQIANIRRVLDAMGIPVLQCPSFEADDVIATVARQVHENQGKCLVVTGDKDIRQCLTERVSILNIRKNQIFNEASLREEWGVRPDQVVDFQALVGDKVDNVPGVPLIGPKNAAELLGRFDTLESVLAHADEVSGKKRKENLVTYADQARLSKRLVKLNDEVPVAIDWDAGRPGRMNAAEVLDLFQEFGFKGLQTRARKLAPAETLPPPVEWKAKYEIVDTPEAFEGFLEKLKKQKRFAFDTETTSTNPRWAEIVGYAFAWKEGEAFYVPVRAPKADPQLDPQTTLEALRPILEDPAVEKIGQNLKYEMVVMRGAGVTLRGCAFDTMIADYLLEAGELTHNIDDLARRYLNHKTTKITELIGVGKKQRQMDQTPTALVGPYAAEDADVPLRLAPILQKAMSDNELDELFANVETPLAEVLAEMEFNGVSVDVEVLAKLSKQYAVKMVDLEKEIHDLAGRKFNIASPKQLSEVLFDELKLPVLRKNKTRASTDAYVLEQLASKHALPAKILEYRQYAKLKGTYVDALPDLVHPQTRRVHTSFNQVVTATGRLSSNDPNLQNIPIRTEVGREIRSAFIPGEADWLLVAADYSQIELRVLAHFSQDETLLDAFARDEDIHARVASEVYGVPLNEVTREQRGGAKTINFGVIYGQSDFGLAKALDIPQEEAAEFIRDYFAKIPGVSEFMTATLDRCREQQYVKTILGRRRSITGVRSAKRRAKSLQKTAPERAAINTVIQGSAADVIKLAMLAVHRRLKTESQLRGRMLLQIHDELVFETPGDQASELAAIIQEEMSGAMQLAVPLKVDIKIGPNWAEQ